MQGGTYNQGVKEGCSTFPALGAGIAATGVFNSDNLARVLSCIELLDGRLGILRHLHYYKNGRTRVAGGG